MATITRQISTRLIDSIPVLALLVLMGVFTTIAIRSASGPLPEGRASQATPRRQPSKAQVRQVAKIPVQDVPIEEITLGRDPGFVTTGRIETVVLRKDGTVLQTVIGLGGEPSQKRRGHLGVQRYRRLEGLFRRLRFFEMDGGGAAVDLPYVSVSARRGSSNKKVLGGGYVVPRGFRQIVQAIDDVVSQVTEWERMD